MVDTNPEPTVPIVIENENENETIKAEDTVMQEPATESLKTLKDNVSSNNYFNIKIGFNIFSIIGL
jgi:hypothetical protein